MARQVVNVGAVANDGTGDPLRTAFVKVNANFAEVYSLIPVDSGGQPIPAAPVDNPHLTGDPTVPTPPAGDSDTSIANTLWVATYFAKLNSPNFTGNPTAPTPPNGDNDNSLATTAWVNTALTLYAPLASPLFTGNPRSDAILANTDSDTSLATTAWVKTNFAHVDPTNPPPAGVDLSAYAPLASPTFTGVPTVVGTPPPLGTGTTQLATCAFVQQELTGTGAPTDPGEIPAIIAQNTAPSPEGRLTLSSAEPVMANNHIGATTIYYTQYVGNKLPIYDGTQMVARKFTEISVNLNDLSYSPTGLAAGKVYDFFVWLDTVPTIPVLRLSHGPEWSTNSARATNGLIVRQDGVWVNNSAIVGNTGGPGVKKGTYVGTVYCAVANQLSWQFGGISTRGRFHVWNCYNRVRVGTAIVENRGSWTVNGGGWRMMNNSAENRAEAVIGLLEDAVDVAHVVMATTSAGAISYIAVALDWVAGSPAEIEPAIFTAQAQGNSPLLAHYVNVPLGFHYWQAIEASTSGPTTFYGQDTNDWASGMTFNARM